MANKKCSKCGFEKEMYNKTSNWCVDCYLLYGREQQKEYRNKYPDKSKASKRKWYDKCRKEVFDHYGNKCCECGCPDIVSISRTKRLSLLELNHINDSYKDAASGIKTVQIFAMLINGERKWEEYNLLCKLCNQHHYIRDVLGIKGFKVVWEGERNDK